MGSRFPSAGIKESNMIFAPNQQNHSVVHREGMQTMASQWGPWEMWNTGKKQSQMWYEKGQELSCLAIPEAVEKGSNFTWPSLFLLGLQCDCSFKDASTRFQFFLV